MCLTGWVHAGTVSRLYLHSSTVVCFHFLPSAPPTQQKEQKVNKKADEGHSISLNCNPPQSSMQPIIHWMDSSEFYLCSPRCVPLIPPVNLSPIPTLFPCFLFYPFPGLRHIRLSDRVMAGKDGKLYFANLLTEDSRDDYTCNIQYLATRTILAKEPITLTVNPCEFFC